MWKSLWQKWTIDKPAAFGDALWELCVVQLAAFLNRLTVRDVIAFIPVVILILAYYHRIPIPPELMLVGDLLAYIDVFSALFLFSVLARAATVLFVVRQAAARIARLLSSTLSVMRHLDVRHRREGGAAHLKRLPRRTNDDDDPVVLHGVAWA